MYNRLIKFTSSLEILYCLQFGFRKNHSSSLALVHLNNKIASSIDRNEITMGIFLDLSKVFDTLNHDILLGLGNLRVMELRVASCSCSCELQLRFAKTRK